MTRPWRKRAVWAGSAAFVTALLVLLYANLTAGAARTPGQNPAGHSSTTFADGSGPKC